MRSYLAPLAVALVLAAAGCGGQGQGAASASATASQAPTAPVSPSDEPSAASAPPTALPQDGSTPSPTPEPTATPNFNLLATENGTVLRSFSPAALDSDDNVGNAAEGIGRNPAPDATPPYVFTFELAGPAKITGFDASLRSVGEGTPPPSITIATSSTSALSGFTDAGTLTADATGTAKLSVDIAARWVRVTTNQLFDRVSATGEIEPLPSGVRPSGIYVFDNSPYAGGSFVPAAVTKDPYHARFTTVGDGLSTTLCTQTGYENAYAGMTSGRTWIAHNGNRNYYFMRSNDKPAFCLPRRSGTGSRRILALDSNSAYSLYPFEEKPPLPQYTFTTINAAMLDSNALAGKEAVVTKLVCNMTDYLSAPQQALLLSWVAAGHKLILTTADECGQGSDFSWLPYPFVASHPGANGSRGDRLIVVEDNALGTSDANDATHFVDARAYAATKDNQIGDADAVKTQDTHWCGHLFGTNSLGINGFMQMYAPYQKGLIVYDAFDHDDGDVPQYQKIRQLELSLPVGSDLPCTQNAAQAFLIQPSRQTTFVPGKARTLHVAMETLANLGWKGHVLVKATGDFSATVSPNEFDLSGGTEPLDIAIAIPVSAKPGQYTVTVTGDAGNGQTAQAAVTLIAATPLKKQTIQKHQRIRIYGIHFDYDSAHIQPRSEPVIAEIAALMTSNPGWHFEVSGHTDSDGGASYNQSLSQRRAQAVVDDLVKGYAIARARLLARGYGLTRPVASNGTDAGKALNRRVELERLQ
jgi:outer membrane protein OmpA-like peptidoglycan-associated protein